MKMTTSKPSPVIMEVRKPELSAYEMTVRDKALEDAACVAEKLCAYATAALIRSMKENQK